MMEHIWNYLKVRKKFWLLPILLAFMVFGIFMMVAPTNPYSPFIYTFF